MASHGLLEGMQLFYGGQKKKCVYYSGKGVGKEETEKCHWGSLREDLLKIICCVRRPFPKSRYILRKGDIFMLDVSASIMDSGER